MYRGRATAPSLPVWDGKGSLYVAGKPLLIQKWSEYKRCRRQLRIFSPEYTRVYDRKIGGKMEKGIV